ncbi:hypothetical protein [Nonomuraea sp. NPDC049646]|uniref:hypothetical protein n=1 Tax=unclassified Nonomuraea TaxID=2593643 RepID=UPI0037BC94C9
MRVSEYFSLNADQPVLDFIDVHVTDDTPIYLDPGAIRTLPGDWGRECERLLTTFFDSVLDAVKMEDDKRLRYLLSRLGEPNETHLGFSKGKSRGRGLGSHLGNQLADKLRASRAAQTGLLSDLEDTELFIEGIGNDIISDITTNIIRGMLIRYTQGVARQYGIPVTSVPSGPVWDPHRLDWEEDFVDLPVVTASGKLLLIPKVLARHGMHLSLKEYYKNYLTPKLQREELDKPNSKLVQILKNGERRVTKLDIEKEYGNSKESIIDLSIPRADAFQEYKARKKDLPSRPLGHAEISRLTQTARPDFNKILQTVLDIPVGPEHADTYHHAIKDLFSAVFYPSLSQPEPEFKIHEGRKRIDIQYTNTATSGFFAWLIRHMVPCKYIFVECKNYGQEVGNPELDQLSSRFSPLRGNVGILACRSFKNKNLFLKRCRDTALDHRGNVLVLDDLDLQVLVQDLIKALSPEVPPGVAADDYPLLKKRFDELHT